jgi:hypothetical protein
LSNIPSLKGLTADDAGWDLELTLQQIAAIYAMQGWPVADRQPTSELLAMVVRRNVELLADNDRFNVSSLGRIIVRRSSLFPTCLEISLEIGHLDFSAALEARDGSANDEE